MATLEAYGTSLRMQRHCRLAARVKTAQCLRGTSLVLQLCVERCLMSKLCNISTAVQVHTLSYSSQVTGCTRSYARKHTSSHPR